MSNKILHSMCITNLNMCTYMFIKNVSIVHITALVHNLYIHYVAKKVTLPTDAHNYSTAIPQPNIYSGGGVKIYPVRQALYTFSTSTTTTTFKLITKAEKEYLNSSLTISLKTIYN